MNNASYVVTPAAQAEGRMIGIAGDVEKRIGRMAKRAAPFTHPAGNRRFHDFILRIEADQVLGIARLEAE